MAPAGLTRYRARIDAELEARLGEWFPDLPPSHRDALHGVLADGKRLRGGLACLVAEALGADAIAALPGAVAIEMVQAASLMHDDFVDGDTRRRGRPAAWTLLSARGAVLLADLLFATAIGTMARRGPRECTAIAEAIAAMAQGALQESLGGGAYRRIIELKTGSLFAAAGRLGALAAGAPPAAVEAAASFGASAGGLYQIADDLADGVAPAESMRVEALRLEAEARRSLAAFPANEHTAALAAVPLTFAPTRWPIRTA